MLWNDGVDMAEFGITRVRIGLFRHDAAPAIVIKCTARWGSTHLTRMGFYQAHLYAGAFFQPAETYVIQDVVHFFRRVSLIPLGTGRDRGRRRPSRWYERNSRPLASFPQIVLVVVVVLRSRPFPGGRSETPAPLLPSHFLLSYVHPRNRPNP